MQHDLRDLQEFDRLLLESIAAAWAKRISAAGGSERTIQPDQANPEPPVLTPPIISAPPAPAKSKSTPELVMS